MDDKIHKISYDEFILMDLRVGEIISCEEVKKSNKLLCFKVRVGESVLQIVSGVKEFYSPEEVIGKKVSVVTNVTPAVIGGLNSQGIILYAEDKEGRVSFIVPEGEVAVGAEIG